MDMLHVTTTLLTPLASHTSSCVSMCVHTAAAVHPYRFNYVTLCLICDHVARVAIGVRTGSSTQGASPPVALHLIDSHQAETDLANTQGLTSYV